MPKITREQIDRLEETFGADHVYVKGRPQRRHSDDDDKTNRRPQNQDARWRRPSPPTANTQQTIEKPVVAEPPPEKKEEKMANTQLRTQPQTFKSFGELRGATQPQQDMESCPICGYRKPKEITVRDTKVRPLVCKGCSDRYHQYGAKVATQLAKGETVVVFSRHAWILSQLDINRFAQELGEVFGEKNRLNNLVEEELRAKGHLPPEVFRPLRDQLQEKLYPEEKTTARQAYGRWRRLQARLEAAKEVRPQVEKMVADEAARNSPPAAEITPPTDTEITTAVPAKKTPRKRTVKAAPSP